MFVGGPYLPVRTQSEVETWRCDACGAFNNEPLQMCSECQAARLDVPSLSTAKKSKKRAGPAKSKTVKAKTSRKKSSKTKTVEIEVERKTDLAEKEESEPLESPIETLEVPVPESLEPTE